MRQKTDKISHIRLGAVQVLCNRTRGEGGVCKNMILYDTGGRGGMPKYDVVLCGGGGDRGISIITYKVS